MSATEARLPPGGTEAGPPQRVGLKLPPPAPPRFSLRSKIFLAAAVLILIAIGGAIAISTFRARRFADAKIADDLKKAGPAWESFQQNRYGELHRALAVVVSNPGLIAVMTTDPLSPATIIDTLKTEQASRARADFLLAADPQGVAVARTDKPLGYSANLSAVPTVSGALAGEDTQGIWFSSSRLYHVVAAPVVMGGSRVVGAIAAGFQVNDDVSRNLKSLMNAEVVFFADEAAAPASPRPVVAASTMPDVSPALLEVVRNRGDLLDAVFRKGMTIGPLPLELSGETWLGYFLPIRSSTNQLVGAAVALRSREKELSVFRQIQNTQLLVGLAALLVAFGLSFILARRITVPVDRLVRATEEVRVGNLDSVDLPVDSNDEIGILARSFNAMIEELKEKAALEEYVRSLPFNVGSESVTLVMGKLPEGAASTASRGAEPQIGQLFAGRYDIQSILGMGGMGIVYKAHDRDLDDVVAIKTLRSEALSADPTLLDRFKQEIRLARRITHPNILRTHDLGETNGLRYLSMEFVKGITLKGMVEQDQLIPTPVALRIAKQICAGLAAAHDVGVIHRDIKPQNIIIESTGGLKVMDFGIARLTQERGMTEAGTVIGTPDYMSPEQARGVDLDFRSDIYSTGVVLFELFTGTLPFEGESSLAIVLKHVQEKPPPPQAKNPRIDPKIAAIILKCMQKDPAERYQSVNQLYEALTRVTA